MDVIGDFLTIIRNGVMVSKPFVRASFSKMKVEIAKILKQEGFIKDYAVEEESLKKKIKVFLKYTDGESVIHEIKRISVPGRRKYAGIKNFEPVIGGLGTLVLTTNKGVMTHKDARKFGVGGEVICEVW